MRSGHNFSHGTGEIIAPEPSRLGRAESGLRLLYQAIRNPYCMLARASASERERERRWQLLPFIWLIIDIAIALAYIAAPWVILARLDLKWPDWLKDGIVLVVLAVIWAGIALYLATQTVLWLGFAP